MFKDNNTTISQFENHKSYGLVYSSNKEVFKIANNLAKMVYPFEQLSVCFGSQ